MSSTPPPTLSTLLSSSSTLSTPSQSRLSTLYNFTSTQRTTNPSGYSANVRWWGQVIEEGMRSGMFGTDRLVVEVADGMSKRLEWHGLGRVKGLGGVISSLLVTSTPESTTPTLFPLTQFLSSQTQLFNPSSSSIPSRILWWAIDKINPFHTNPSTAQESALSQPEYKLWKLVTGKSFIHLPLLEESATMFLAYIALNPPTLHSSKIFTVQTFREVYSGRCIPASTGLIAAGAGAGQDMLSIQDCKVLLKYLSRDKGVLVSDFDEEVYKLLPTDTSEAVATVVTEADKGTVAITKTIGELERQVGEIEAQISTAHAKASRYLSLSQKSIALSYLRSKKQLEELLTKRIGSLESLKSVLRGIDGAIGDVEIMQAYESSTKTLSSLLSHPSLQLSHVNETMDSLSQVLADQQEIDFAIQQGGKSAVSASGGDGDLDVMDDEELGRELEELVAAEKRKEKGKADDAGGEKRPRIELPAIPKTNLPSTSAQAQKEDLQKQPSREAIAESMYDQYT